MSTIEGRSRSSSLTTQTELRKTQKRKADAVGNLLNRSKKNLTMNCWACKEKMEREEVRCMKCGADYHFSSCALDMETWMNMTSREKAEWRCQTCENAQESLCAKCGLLVEKAEVFCYSCNKDLHYACSIQRSTWAAKSEQKKREWECALCRARKEKEKSQGKDNNEELATNQEVNLNEIFSLLQKNSKTLADTAAEIKSLSNKLDQNNKKITSLENQLIAKDKQMENLEKKFQSLEDKYNEMVTTRSGVGEGNEETAGVIDQLRSELVQLQQRSRIKNIELQNVPQQPEEDIEAIVIKAAQILGVNVTEQNIESAHRLPKVKNKHPPIIVQFNSRKIKEDFLKKRKKTMTQDNLIGNGNGDLIYVKENLCKFYRNLEMETRKKFKKEREWKFVWYKNYSINIRRNEDSAIYKIRHYGDLEEMLRKTDSQVGSRNGLQPRRDDQIENSLTNGEENMELT